MALDHVEGATEPWAQELLTTLLRSLCRRRPTVLECGGFLGHTSVALADAMERFLEGGTLTIAEWDPDAPERADAVDARLAALNLVNVNWRVVRSDALVVIASLADESLDLVYLDDEHSKPHVHAEITALLPKMKPGGLVCGHDVHGSADLQTVFREFGGIALDLPRLGPAGGLGIIQC